MLEDVSHLMESRLQWKRYVSCSSVVLNIFVSLESHYQHVIELYKKLCILNIVNLWRTVIDSALLLACYLFYLGYRWLVSPQLPALISYFPNNVTSLTFELKLNLKSERCLGLEEPFLVPKRTFQ